MYLPNQVMIWLTIISLPSSKPFIREKITFVFRYNYYDNNSLGKNEIDMRISYFEMVQDDTLSGDVASMDLTSRKNLEDLVQVGEELLKKPVAKVNLGTGIYEPYHCTSNEEALIRY